MKKNNMHYDINLTKINKDIYRPSSNLSRFVKSVLTVLLVGRSPIGAAGYSRKRF